MPAIIQNIDESIMLFFQEHIRCGVLNPIMVFVTYLGEAGALWIIIALYLIISKKNSPMGVDILVSVVLCFCINDLIIKNIFMRPRPFLTVPGLESIVRITFSSSFPSGHACAGFAASYAITKDSGGKLAWVYVVAALIAISRVYVGVHYTTDIIFGALIGTLGSIVLLKLRRKFFPMKGEL